MTTPIAPFNSQHLEAACRVLADTERGLTGTQIERLLQEINVADTSPGMTKWKRLIKIVAPRGEVLESLGQKRGRRKRRGIYPP